MKASAARVTELREVMDIRQAADYLGISPDTLYKYASEAFIPAFKLGNRWRFRRSRLDEWMDRQSGLAERPEVKVRPKQKKPVRGVKTAARRSAVVLAARAQASRDRS
ncbi:MAG TPA: helix-turn-helix domain-containing protein [Acidobacteriaceae bacterium]|nr:helix-turn-helix domain-containing protein [Acidobacteriaceae bacterium]